MSNLPDKFLILVKEGMRSPTPAETCAMASEILRLRYALAAIAAGAPEEKPEVLDEYWGWVSSGNTDDVAKDAASLQHWTLAEIARAALGEE